eukprot:scaffold25338_cov181-Cylindrotheca_fusiformis.AAC.1
MATQDMLENEGGNENNNIDCVTPTEPWLIFTVGPRGAGKKQVVKDLTLEGHLNLLTFIDVDTDAIRRRLPEFDSYVKSRPESVDELTGKEAGLIAEILTLAALQAGRNVIVDGCLEDAEWHLERVEKLKNEYSCLKVGIFHVTAPYQLIVKHSQKKAIETGRQISDDSICRCISTIPHSLEVMRRAVDFICEIHNGEDQCELVGDMDWKTFELQFMQTCAWKPGMHGKQKHDVSRRQSLLARQISVQHSQCLRKRFSVLISSEENNAADNMTFYGKFSHIRKTLDYSYHSNYTFERQKLQDAIISDMLDDALILDVEGKIGTVPTKPWIVFTAGAMGCGKSYTMNRLVQSNPPRFPLRAFIKVDPDEIRRLLPEYHMYINKNANLAGELTRKEAGYIAEILTLAALQGGKNVLQDGSLRDAEWYKVYFQRLRDEFPSVRQAIIHVTAPREAVFKRAAARAVETGRVVPREVLEAALRQVPKSVEILSPLVDYYAEINNSEDSPDIELVKPAGSNWEDFKKTWLQNVAYVPNRQKFLEKAKRQLQDTAVPKEEPSYMQ